MMETRFWSDRSVLITGHTGFKGSWLALWLRALGARVSGLALAPEGATNLYTILQLEREFGTAWVDVRDASAVAARVRDAQPEIIFHLAGQALVRRGYREPLATYATNVMGTAHVLEAARDTSVRAMVVVTSDKCYEDRESPRPYRENDLLGGSDPYSNSKACAELVASAYRRSFLAANGCALATARAGNVVGGGDWSEDRLLPDLIRAFTHGAAVRLRNPAAVRPWQHVLEPLAGYMKLAESLCSAGQQFAQAWNFGPGIDANATVEQIATAAANAWAGAAPWVGDEEEAPRETHVLRLDASKSRTLLHWRPRLTFEETMNWTMCWYRAWHAGDDMLAYTKREIERYEGLPA